MNSVIPPPSHLLYGVNRSELTHENETEMSVVKNSAGSGFDVPI
jgi:hypothetical protein